MMHMVGSDPTAMQFGFIEEAVDPRLGRNECVEFKRVGRGDHHLALRPSGRAGTLHEVAAIDDSPELPGLQVSFGPGDARLFLLP